MSTFADYVKSNPAPATAPEGFLQKAGNFVINAGKDAVNTLITTPAIRLAQAGSQLIRPFLSPQNQANLDIVNSQPMTTPGGITVDPQKTGVAGAEQIGGQALKSASYLVPGGAAEGIASGGIKQGILQGTKIGAISGAAGQAGQSMTQGGSASDVASAAVSGATTGAIAGGITGGATGLAGNIWNKAYNPSSYDTTLANATVANNQAGEGAVQGANEASQMIYGAKGNAGSQFAQAPKIIEQTDPTLGFDLKASTAEKLNALKDTKAFSLPDYLRPSSDNFGNGSIDISKLGGEDASGIKLTPIQTQNLITQLHDLEFNSKGDVVVNQKTQNLINEVKSQAQATFGHVTDSQGNSVWDKAYQGYGQTMDAVKAMDNIVNINKTSGGMSDPMDIDKAIKNVLSLQDTPQGRASLGQAVQEFKSRTGYDLSNPVESISKLIDSNKELQDAIKGGFMKQVQRAVTSPSAVGRRLLYAATSLVGIASIGTVFRKQIGSFISGQ